jgi:saccharopine dehydrogenase (NAD+, L-lysine forming)
MPRAPRRPHLWIRAELSPEETRTPLVPLDAQVLIEAGFQITVERSPYRVFRDEAYQQVGCALAPQGSWRESLTQCFILGINPLPEENGPLKHRHLFFGQANKGLGRSTGLFKRLSAGRGVLLDLDHLTDDSGNRITSMSYWAGFVGAGLAIQAFVAQKEGRSLGPVSPFGKAADFVKWVKEPLKRLEEAPKFLILGSSGRVGRGAQDFLRAVEITGTKWDRERTGSGGPVPQILKFDVALNGIASKTPGAPLLTREFLARDRRLSVIADVACDVGNPSNRFPLTETIGSFEKPVERIFEDPSFDLIAIDRLPALLPRESSDDFSSQLAPLLEELPQAMSEIWERVEAQFREQMKQAGRRQSADDRRSKASSR